MNLNREERERLTIMHDEFAKQYNLFIEECLKHWDKEKNVEEAILLSELRIHSIITRQALEATAAVMDKLGWWHRNYKPVKRIAQEAASQLIHLS